MLFISFLRRATYFASFIGYEDIILKGILICMFKEPNLAGKGPIRWFFLKVELCGVDGVRFFQVYSLRLIQHLDKIPPFGFTSLHGKLFVKEVLTQLLVNIYNSGVVPLQQKTFRWEGNLWIKSLRKWGKFPSCLMNKKQEIKQKRFKLWQKIMFLWHSILFPVGQN